MIIRVFRLLTAIIIPALLPILGHAGPLHIESGHMLLDHKKSQVEFSGQVLLTRDDFKLQCDKLVAHYQEGQQQLEKAEAYGHIRMRQGEAHGQSDEAMLDHKNGILTMTGHAFIEQNGSRIEGQTITHLMNKQQTTVTPGKDGRTRMILESTDQPPSPVEPEKNP